MVFWTCGKSNKVKLLETAIWADLLCHNLFPRKILSIEVQVAELREFAKRKEFEVIDYIIESKTAFMENL